MLIRKTATVLGMTAALLAVPMLSGEAKADHDDRGKRHRARVVHKDSHRGSHHRHKDHHDYSHRSHGKSHKSGLLFELVFGSGHHHHHRRHRRVVRHHYGHGTSSVCTRGRYDSRWVPPVYCTRYDPCGRAYRVIVRSGYYDRVWVPGRCYTTKSHSCRY